MLIVKKEDWKDLKEVETLLKKSFDGDKEAILVNKLRLSKAFIPDLSLVARMDWQLVGHIMLTSLEIQEDKGSFTALALAPLAIDPVYQRQGYGTRLMNMAINESRRLGHSIIVVLGDPDFYSRFEFVPAVAQGIIPPDQSWGDAFQVLELVPDALKDLTGRAIYPPEFGV